MPADPRLSYSGLTDVGLSASALKKRGDIQSKPDGSDDQGGLYDRPGDWSLVAHIFYRDITQPISVIVGEQLVSVLRHIIICRYITGITGGMRILTDMGKILYIQVAGELGDGLAWTKMIATEEKDPGIGEEALSA